ncbi:MAG: (Fe-S)-binding protein, partial [Rhodospirillaceae bacterium]
TCCGQPAYNSGDEGHAKAIAKQVIATFESFDYVVVPSGSCGGTLKIHYSEMFVNEPEWKDRAARLADKTFELTQFLVSVVKLSGLSVEWSATATYHDSCSGLRELGIKGQPRELLDKVSGLTLNEGAEAETCCGFGGLFCVKYGEVSDQIVANKVADIEATGAGLVLGGDLGCLMNVAGKLKRRGSAVEVRHVAEVLAGMDDVPAIAEPDA